MDLENSIKNVIQQKLEDGTIETIIAAKLEKGVNDAMDDLFRSYGDVGKVIKDKVKEVMVPAIENHDFSNHLTKLDSILTEIVNSTALAENKKLLENFKELMIEEKRKEIKTSELFEQWCKYVEDNVSTSGLEVNTDDSPTYESVEVAMSVEYEENRSWSDFEKADIVFECEHDEDMNFSVPISRWKKYDGDKWKIDYKATPDIISLKHMKDFELFLIKLQKAYINLFIDDEDCQEEITPSAEPEVDFV